MGIRLVGCALSASWAHLSERARLVLAQMCYVAKDTNGRIALLSKLTGTVRILGSIAAGFPTQEEEQETEARAAMARAGATSSGPIVTTIEPLSEWYPAEDYHQEYWETSGRSNPYCMAVIPPKLQKLRKSFAARSKAAVTA